MRSFVLLGSVVGMALALVACGGSEKSTTGSPTTASTVASATPPTTAQGAAAGDDDEYELDVIAEAEPDEGAPPL